jgi:DNA repair photolyase
MNIAPVSLPLFPGELPQPFDGAKPENASPSRHLPRLEWVDRRGALLHPIPKDGEEEVLGLNLSRGCTHQCAFCAIRAYPGYAGDGVLYAYANTAVSLAQELATRRQLPRAVLLCPATDPFPPQLELQAEAARTVEVLAANGVQAWVMTRGIIRPPALQVLVRRREWVKVMAGLTTLDPKLQRSLEPLAASSRLRLRQVGRLRRLGLDVRVALEPLIPGLTDTRENLRPLLQALAKEGIRQLTASYLFLRPGIEELLNPVLDRLGVRQTVEEAYVDGPLLSANGLAPARYLPLARRQRGYAALMVLAAEMGIAVRISATTNPDFVKTRPATPSPTSKSSLLSQFLQQGRHRQGA